MKKILENSSETKAYLNSLPKIYLVACWAGYGVMDFPFTGKYYQDKNGISIPLVYDYDDFNGIGDDYYLRRIDHTTTGQIVLWTQSLSVAKKVAELFNKEMKNEMP